MKPAPLAPSRALLLTTSMTRTPLAILFAATFLALPTLADAHKWEISEIFSNADGTIQFVEWFNTEDGEQFLSLEAVSTASGGFLAFPNDLNSAATSGRNFLMATAAFAAIPGAPTPDYIISNGFLSPAGDTINYTGGDGVAFGALPQDGKTSITRTGTGITNSPRNFAGQSGSVRLALTAFRNGSGLNRTCYSSSAPVLGTTWTGTLVGGPGANVVAIIGYQGASSGIILAGGELLVNIAAPHIFTVWTLNGGASTSMNQMVPNDPSLLEFPLSTQGVVISGGVVEFCNAVDLLLGH